MEISSERILTFFMCSAASLFAYKEFTFIFIHITTQIFAEYKKIC